LNLQGLYKADRKTWYLIFLSCPDTKSTTLINLLCRVFFFFFGNSCTLQSSGSISRCACEVLFGFYMGNLFGEEDEDIYQFW